MGLGELFFLSLSSAIQYASIGENPFQLTDDDPDERFNGTIVH